MAFLGNTLKGLFYVIWLIYTILFIIVLVTVGVYKDLRSHHDSRSKTKIQKW